MPLAELDCIQDISPIYSPFKLCAALLQDSSALHVEVEPLQ